MSDAHNRSSSELEREVEDSRARINDTLNEIRDRMSPGQIVDEVVAFAKNNGGADFARNLGTQARDNPLPVLLIGAGIAWLMSGRRPATATYGHHAQEPSGPGAFSKIGESINRTVHDVRDAATGAFNRATDMGSRATGSVTGAAGSMRDTASGVYGSATDGIARGREMYEHRREQGQALLQDIGAQPLLVAAIGVALGAALGGMLPATRAEDRLMGSAADDIKHRTRDAAAEGYERGREVVKAAVEEGKHKAEEQGLMPSNGNGHGANTSAQATEPAARI
jgi:hypothetical protein